LSRRDLWYQVRPVTYFLLRPEDQNAHVDAFKEFLNMLRQGIEIYAVRKPIEVRHEDTAVKGWVTEFFIRSREPIRRLDVSPLTQPPDLPRPERVLPNAFLWRGRAYSAVAVLALPSRVVEGVTISRVMEVLPYLRMAVVPVRDDLALNVVRKRLRLMRTLAASYEVEGRFGDPRVRREAEELEGLLNELVARETKLFRFSLVGLAEGESPAEAYARAKDAANLLRTLGFGAVAPRYVHWELWVGRLTPQVFTETHTVGAFYPFITSSLVEAGGVFVGLSRIDESPVVLDLWGHSSYNITVLGRMGSGKSSFAKKLLYEYGTKHKDMAFFVIDRTGEYVPVLKELKAQVIEVGRGRKLGFDPFRLLPPEHAAAFIAAHTRLEPELYSQLQRLAARHRSLRTVYDRAPRKLKDMLSGLIHGPLGWVYAGGSLELGDRVGVVLKDLGSPEAEGLVGAMFLLAFVQRVKDLPRARRKMLVIDEFLQVLEAFRTYDVISWLLMFFKNTRKWFTSVVYIAHDPREVFVSGHGAIIASQLSAVKALFAHDPNAAKEAQRVFSLTDREVGYLTDAGVGDALLMVESSRIPVHVVLSRREFKMFETRPFVGEEGATGE